MKEVTTRTKIVESWYQLSLHVYYVSVSQNFYVKCKCTNVVFVS